MKKNNRPICHGFFVLILVLAIQLAPSKILATETQDSYAFMSAQDLYDALSQQSQVALGYMLGIVDAKKGVSLLNPVSRFLGGLMPMRYW